MKAVISSRIRFIYLFSMISLVFVHGYTLETQLQLPSDLIGERMDFTSFFEMLTINSLLRFRIPLLMLFSGFLMAKSTYDSHVCLIKSRFKSLLIPFFLISILSILLVFVLEEIFYPNSSTAIWVTRVDQLGFKGLIYRIFINPFAYQLWYIKFLFLLAVLFPVFKFLNNRIPIAFLVALFILWVLGDNIHLLKHARFTFFFVLGMWIFEKQIDIVKQPKWFSTSIFLMIYIFLGIVKTYLSFKGIELMGGQVVLVTRLLLDANILVGILLFWFGINPLVTKVENLKIYERTTKYGFFIYAFHAPIINLLNTPALTITKSIIGNRLIVFLILPILVIFLCAILHELVKRFNPIFFQLLTGARIKGSETPALLVQEPDFTNTYFRINKDLASRYALFSQQLTY